MFKFFETLPIQIFALFLYAFHKLLADLLFKIIETRNFTAIFIVLIIRVH